jgi:hypothetical protein
MSIGTACYGRIMSNIVVVERGKRCVQVVKAQAKARKGRVTVIRDEEQPLYGPLVRSS